MIFLLDLSQRTQYSKGPLFASDLDRAESGQQEKGIGSRIVKICIVTMRLTINRVTDTWVYANEIQRLSPKLNDNIFAKYIGNNSSSLIIYSIIDTFNNNPHEQMHDLVEFSGETIPANKLSPQNQYKYFHYR